MGLISAILFGTFFFSFFGFWAFKTRSWRDFQPVFFFWDGESWCHETRGAIERGKVGRVDTRAVTMRQVNEPSHSNVTWLQVVLAVLQGCFVMA